jgi:hypothetical protein
MVIWDYDVPAAAKSVGWAVTVNNIEALNILLDCGYSKAAMLCGIGALCRALVGWAVLRAVGLEGGWGETGVMGEVREGIIWGSEVLGRLGTG